MTAITRACEEQRNSAIAGGDTLFELDFHYKGFQCPGVKCALISVALIVGGIDLVAAVIGLDPSASSGASL